MATPLPIPPAQLRYADPSQNVQSMPIEARIDHLHYPTLGCPELLRRGAPLRVLLSLPADAGVATVGLTLFDRHGAAKPWPIVTGAVEPCGAPEDGRVVHQVTGDVSQVPSGLYDLIARWEGGEEVQRNAVRIFDEVTGRIVISGDAQYNVKNEVCLASFVSQLRNVEADFIVMIGDVCDNGVKSHWNVVRLATRAGDPHVECYYQREYPGAHTLLAELDKPIFLVPGNHDGMVAYARNEPGQSTIADGVVVGPDPRNEVAYDGLQHFRRTFGPTYYALDWEGTRYFFLNSFELLRHDRLGFHCIVSNWGGAMQDAQLDWLEQALEEAKGRHKVVFVHHDPRAGDQGRSLGHLHAYRPYDFQRLRDVAVSYLRYFAEHRSLSQQEWMAREGEDLETHHLRRLQSLLVAHGVETVFMGHDNENWIDTYEQGEKLCVRPRDPLPFEPLAVAGEVPPTEEGVKVPEGAVAAIATALEQETLAETLSALEALDPTLQDDDLLDEALRRGLQRYLGDEPRPFAFVDGAAAAWQVAASASMHFVHVDDVGAYQHRWPWHFRKYGYVLAELQEGRPVRVTSYRLNGQVGRTEPLFVV